MRQWMLRITAYAERLIAELEGLTGRIDQNAAAQLDRPQRRCRDRLHDRGIDARLRVFTTARHGFVGATYMVLAPEHPLVNEITTEPASRKR
jgi:leucyl-tRNA synthetase